MEQFGQRPLARLNGLGLLSPRLVAVHMTQLIPAEIDAVAKHGVHVVHCPESNLKLASGLCPAQALKRRGINLALGTDGPASNNDLDMFGEMRSAALLAKAVANDSAALPAHEVLEMATLGGARALDFDRELGSLKPGKQADIVAVNLSDPATQPLYDPISQLVYSATRQQVTDVWVQGRQLLKNRELLTLDTERLLSVAREWRARIQGSGIRDRGSGIRDR
jgi:5-methylthioadenosine/S-adenosylhomocysteine deaminase